MPFAWTFPFPLVPFLWLCCIKLKNSTVLLSSPDAPPEVKWKWLAAALEDAELRRAALQARGVDLAVPAVRMGREPTVQNTRGGESLGPTRVRGGVGVDDETAAAIEKGAKELSARRRGAKGAAETGTWHDKFLARYGLDKTAGR